ncbi:MAG: hypothetical protein AB8G11_13935 [Saprospiraceae bacterium]
MGEIIAEIIGYIFVKVIFQGIILGILRVIRGIGIIIIKIITFNKESFSEISQTYKGSLIPYLVGLSLTIVMIYLLI